MITWQEFVTNWGKSGLRETQGYQSHFNELCQLVNHKTPTQFDPEGTFFTFEENTVKATGGKGRADVWYAGHFAWEYKGKHKDLDAAYAQVSAYRGALGNPPLLVVCDFLEYRIYPQWTNSSGLPFVFKNDDLLNPDSQRFIRWLLEDPEQFKQLRQTELEQREKLTLQLAEKFAHLADLMRTYSTQEKLGWSDMRIARFLTKLVFIMFVEDVELLPRVNGLHFFEYMLENAGNIHAPGAFEEILQELFEAMDGRRPHIFMKLIPYFNGGLFHDTQPNQGDGLEVLSITEFPDVVKTLREIVKEDWRFVNPTIFGTLFEGALDPSKRAQLGAHYTSESDIRLVVEPVLMQPLEQQWIDIRAEAEPLLQTFLDPHVTVKARIDTLNRLTALHDQMMNALEQVRVLDPACGSGNFLYVSLRALKDLERGVRRFFEPVGLPFRDVVTPRQLHGIEKDPFAARLAHVVVWIGYLQWRYEDEGMLHPVYPRTIPHPRSLPNPIIMDKLSEDEPDRILNDDAILRYDTNGKPYEPEWAHVDVIMGNPPFLGDKKMRREMGDGYVDDLRKLYTDRVPGGADLVTYWYEKARAHIEAEHARTAGLLATQSIRAGANRLVLERIKQSGDIFMAWSDRPWTLEGAAVRISIVGFDNRTRTDYKLDGAPVNHINSDLQNTIDATKAQLLSQNAGLAFIGTQKGGDFDISESQAKSLIQADEQNQRVVRRWMNADDITGRPKNKWIINFEGLSLEEARKFAEPLRYVEENVKPSRDSSRDQASKDYWWQLQRYRPAFIKAIEQNKRYIATPRVAKHRLFIWSSLDVVPDSRVVAIARDDDYFFGVLHSTPHETWAIRLASWHGKGNDPTYNAESCFETFPFPVPPGKEDATSPHYTAISAAAKQLYEEREAWLNPPDLIALGAQPDDPVLRDRTLTNLYNALEDHRGVTNGNESATTSAATNGNSSAKKRSPRENDPAKAFAPRLAELHAVLDRAVLAAYGWDDLFERLRSPEGDEELLRRLLALNLERASA